MNLANINIDYRALVKNSSCFYHVPRAVCRPLSVCSCLALRTIQEGKKCYHHPYFPGDETEAQKRGVSCP